MTARNTCGRYEARYPSSPSTPAAGEGGELAGALPGQPARAAGGGGVEQLGPQVRLDLGGGPPGDRGGDRAVHPAQHHERQTGEHRPNDTPTPDRRVARLTAWPTTRTAARTAEPASTIA